MYQKSVNNMLKQHPHLAQPLWQHARTLLGLPQSGSVVALESAPPPADSALSSDAASSPRASKFVGRSKKVSDLSVADLKRVLYFLDPIAMSPFALRALAKRGARDASKENLCRLLEYLTAIAGHFVLDPPFNELAEFEQYAASMHVKNGALAKVLILPPDYHAQGHWSVEALDEISIIILRRRDGEKRRARWESLTNACIIV